MTFSGVGYLPCCQLALESFLRQAMERSGHLEDERRGLAESPEYGLPVFSKMALAPYAGEQHIDHEVFKPVHRLEEQRFFRRLFSQWVFWNPHDVAQGSFEDFAKVWAFGRFGRQYVCYAGSRVRCLHRAAFVVAQRAHA